MFADPGSEDFHLRSAAGRWTPDGYVKDTATSPAFTADGTELGAYGGTMEASRFPG